MNSTRHTGSITLIVLVFGGIFFMVLISLSSYLLAQNRLQDVTRIRAEAFSVAEAGLEYYRWHLVHFPSDLQNGTGAPGPYPVTVPGPAGSTAGTAELSITPITACGQTISIDISSTGIAADGTSSPVTLVARYAKPSISSYDIVTNSAMWFGSTETINGPIHSNNGIHEDGPNNAPVTSSVSTWRCTGSLGCSNETENGVFGNGTNPNLWNFPVPTIDFQGIAADFNSDKAIAQSYGIYIPRYSTGNQAHSSAYHKGYHLVFNAPNATYPNGSVTVTRVTPTRLDDVYIFDTSSYGSEYSLLHNQTSAQVYPIPSGCGLIFVEDNAWIDGTIPTKVTVIVANVSTPGIVPDAFISGNISYSSADGSDGLTLISQHDILITPDSPQNLTINGVFIAQTGSFGRNGYWGSAPFCNGTYEPRGTFSIHGSIIASLGQNETWIFNNNQTCGNAAYAGYQTTVNSPDQMLTTNPPAFTPTLSNDYRFITWRQQQ